MSISQTIVVIALGLLSFRAFSQETADLDQCLNSGTTQDQVVCLQNIHAKEDARLNHVYSKAMAASSGQSKALADVLKKSELSWIKFRDDWCNFQGRWEEGTLGKIAQLYCLTLQSRERANGLTFYGGTTTPMAAKNDCDCRHEQAPYCSSLTDLYAQSKVFRTKLLAAFKAASIQKPDWVPNGLQTAGFPAVVGAQKALLAYLSEPHNAPHRLAVVFTCTSGWVAGTFIDDTQIQARFGKPSKEEMDVIVAHMLERQK